MHIAIVTLFPELFGAFLSTSLVERAKTKELVTVDLVRLRPHGVGKHLSVDDTPYGGGSGMVLRVDCVVGAIEEASELLVRRDSSHSVVPRRVLLTPQGTPFHQSAAERLSTVSALILVCGRYEGFDERVRTFVDEEISMGDFILIGGEVAAMAVVEACTRLLPGVLGNEASTCEESFSGEQQGLLEYPQYTRPPSFRGHGVPDVLKSGDHAKIRAWRREQSIERTRLRRADLVSESGRRR